MKYTEYFNSFPCLHRVVCLFVVAVVVADVAAKDDNGEGYVDVDVDDDDDDLNGQR